MRRILINLGLGILCVSCFKDADDDLRLTLCDTSINLVLEDEFAPIVTSNYRVDHVQLEGDCLEITVQTGGCNAETMAMALYALNSPKEQDLANQLLKVEVEAQDCMALIFKTVSFDLMPLRQNGQNELFLELEGWAELLVYAY